MTSYLEIIQGQWENILKLYRQFEDKKPVMLFDIQDNTVYAYPYEGFKAELNQKSQRHLEHQYERALATDSVIVFVRDREQNNLVSYSLQRDE
jgi:hypothetical protein